jgi:hypothetical protein
LEQYNPADVTLERQGDLDDPSYIEAIPDDSPLRTNQNVFAFGLGVGSLEVLQLLTMVVAPGGVSDVGSQHYNIKTGEIVRETRSCKPTCPYSTTLLGAGEQATFSPVGAHPAAVVEREARRRRQQTRAARIGRGIDRAWSLLSRFGRAPAS